MNFRQDVKNRMKYLDVVGYKKVQVLLYQCLMYQSDGTKGLDKN